MLHTPGYAQNERTQSEFWARKANAPTVSSLRMRTHLAELLDEAVLGEAEVTLLRAVVRVRRATQRRLPLVRVAKGNNVTTVGNPVVVTL